MHKFFAHIHTPIAYIKVGHYWKKRKTNIFAQQTHPQGQCYHTSVAQENRSERTHVNMGEVTRVDSQKRREWNSFIAFNFISNFLNNFLRKIFHLYFANVDANVTCINIIHFEWNVKWKCNTSLS